MVEITAMLCGLAFIVGYLIGYRRRAINDARSGVAARSDGPYRTASEPPDSVTSVEIVRTEMSTGDAKRNLRYENALRVISLSPVQYTCEQFLVRIAKDAIVRGPDNYEHALQAIVARRSAPDVPNHGHLIEIAKLALG